MCFVLQEEGCYATAAGSQRRAPEDSSGTYTSVTVYQQTIMYLSLHNRRSEKPNARRNEKKSSTLLSARHRTSLLLLRAPPHAHENPRAQHKTPPTPPLKTLHRIENNNKSESKTGTRRPVAPSRCPGARRRSRRWWTSTWYPQSLWLSSKPRMRCTAMRHLQIVWKLLA